MQRRTFGPLPTPCARARRNRTKHRSRWQIGATGDLRHNVVIWDGHVKIVLSFAKEPTNVCVYQYNKYCYPKDGPIIEFRFPFSSVWASPSLRTSRHHAAAHTESGPEPLRYCRRSYQSREMFCASVSDALDVIGYCPGSQRWSLLRRSM